MRSHPILAVVLLAAAAFLLTLDVVSTSARSANERVAGEASLDFRRGTLPIDGVRPTALTLGPDGRLYVAYDVAHNDAGAESMLSDMTIAALTLDPATKEITDVEVLAEELNRVLGLAFDPLAPPEAPVLYASRQEKTATDGFEGVVSSFAAPDWAMEDVITGLPSSAPSNNHFTNGLAFDDTGRLFMAQGSATDAGLADPPGPRDYFPETPLSAAILYADVHAPDFDGAITYAPPGPPEDNNVAQTGGDVFIFAPGTRNPYDLVLHSNGHIYATDNGPNGPDTSLDCGTDGGFVDQADELNLIEEGNYYGFPNRNRGLHAPGEERQCVYRSPDEEPGKGEDFTPPIAVLPDHCSCNGLAEYTSDALGGALLGDLVYTALARSQVYRVNLSSDGREVLSIQSIARGLDQPLDIAVDDDGTMYVAEFTGGRITYLAPDSDGDGCHDSRELGSSQALGGRRDPEDPWDFYDVTDDGVVNMIDDVLAVAAGFGPDSGPNYDPALDRSAAPPGAEPWQLGPPDGTISVPVDIMGVIGQFGHTCASS